MHTVDKNYSFINCDYPCSVLIEAAHRAVAPDERSLFLSFLLQYLDFVLWRSTEAVSQEDENASMAANTGPYEPGELSELEALHAAKYCLRDEVCMDAVWRWVRDLIEKASGSGQGAELLRSLLAVGIFSDMLTEPLGWDDPGEMIAMDRLFGCYDEPHAKWAVLEGFRGCTMVEARATISQYNQWRSQQGREPLHIPDTELRGYVVAPDNKKNEFEDY